MIWLLLYLLKQSDQRKTGSSPKNTSPTVTWAIHFFIHPPNHPWAHLFVTPNTKEAFGWLTEMAVQIQHKTHLNAHRETEARHSLMEWTHTSADSGFHEWGVKEELFGGGCNGDFLSRPKGVRRVQAGGFILPGGGANMVKSTSTYRAQ